jgi:hypothetical protein
MRQRGRYCIAAAAVVVATAAHAETPLPAHRATSCSICEEQASAFNVAIDRRERDAASSPDAAAFESDMARLAKALDVCEASQCPASIASPDVTRAAPESDATRTTSTDAIGGELAVAIRYGDVPDNTSGAFPAGGYGARAGVRFYGVYLGAELTTFPSSNYCFMGPCSQRLRMLGGVAGFDIELLPILVLRPHLDMGNATFFADYDCTGTPNCTSIPHSPYFGGGMSVLLIPPLPLPRPWRPFVGFDISVLTTTFNGEEFNIGEYPRIPLSPASSTFDSCVLSLDLGIRI